MVMPLTSVECPICGSDCASVATEQPNSPGYDCPICGRYRLTERAAQRLFEQNLMAGPNARTGRALNNYLLSGVLRERQELAGGAEVVVYDFDQLCRDARPLPGGPLEAVDRILEYVERHAEFTGAAVHLRPGLDYPIAYARHAGEFRNLIKQIAEPLGILAANGTDPIMSMTITTPGWERLRVLHQSHPQRRQAFIAMWFDPAMISALDNGIAPALRECGYRPVRIDREEHNDRIDDRIVAAIRQSGIVVADFTGQRGGVYYEAGFAAGLGIPVVWCCRDDDVEHLHFDTRQYNHIVWRTPEELRLRLVARIQATLPTYPRDDGDTYPLTRPITPVTSAS